MLRSLEQDRAKYAWECIKKVKDLKDADTEKKYKSYVKKAPVLILTNGLGNALAFFNSKNERAYKLLYEHLDAWTKNEIRKDIIEWIVNDASSIEVFKKTEEIIALLNWMKRFAEAELKDE